MEGLLKLTGLWKSTTTSGKAMLAGSLTPGVRVIVLPNDRKRNESDPDYALFVAAARPKKGGAGAAEEEPPF
jgi:hypothetical protein